MLDTHSCVAFFPLLPPPSLLLTKSIICGPICVVPYEAKRSSGRIPCVLYSVLVVMNSITLLGSHRGLYRTQRDRGLFPDDVRESSNDISPATELTKDLLIVILSSASMRSRKVFQSQAWVGGLGISVLLTLRIPVATISLILSLFFIAALLLGRS